jgi:hypothetical protein
MEKGPPESGPFSFSYLSSEYQAGRERVPTFFAIEGVVSGLE